MSDSVLQPAPVSLPSASAQQVYQDYNRRHRLRMAQNISLFLVITVASIVIVRTLLFVVQGVFVTNPLTPVLFMGCGLLIGAFLGGGYWLSRHQKVEWSTGIVTSISIFSTCLLSLFANYLVLTVHVSTQLGFLSLTIGIIIAGFLGTITWIIATVLFLNVYSVVAMFVLLPDVLHQQSITSLPLVLLILLVQWVIGALMMMGQANYQQTISDLRDAEIAYERAQQLDELKDQFISSVNHELRNPLMAMMNYVTILKQRHEVMSIERRAQALASLEGTGKRVVDLVGSILDVRQMAEHPEAFEANAVPIKATLMTASTLLDPAEARMAERELRIDIPDQLDIWGNDIYLQQILTNLLSNAVKYSSPGTPITVQAQLIANPIAVKGKQERPQPMVEIVVRDRGLGIPPAQIPLLFNRFVRLSRDLTSRTIGNGLGLYLCKVLSEAMGGNIWVESSGVEGEGSAFHIVLPQEPAYLADNSLIVTQKRSAVSVARFSTGRTRLAIAAILVCLIGGLFIVQNHSANPPRVNHPAASGIAHFLNANGGYSNSMNLSIADLAAPPAGAHYQVWLIDPVKEQILSLGSLVLQGHAYTLAYSSDEQNTNLLGAGTVIEITQEHGTSPAPLGKVMLSGVFPPNAFIHIRHLLLDFPTTPANKGLLVGLVQQTQILDQQAHQLQSSGKQNPQLTHCLTLNMLAIIEGTHGKHYQALPGACLSLQLVSGDGYGLLPSPVATAPGSGYLDGATAHLALTLQQPDATDAMHDLGGQVINSLATLKSATMTLDAKLVTMLTTPNTSPVASLSTLADTMYGGEANASQSVG